MNEPLDLGWHHKPVLGTGCDACTLLAEVERLRAELARWQEIAELLGDDVERLRAEAESEGRTRRSNSRSARFLIETIGLDEPEVMKATAAINAGDVSDENDFGHIAAAYITRLRGELAPGGAS